MKQKEPIRRTAAGLVYELRHGGVKNLNLRVRRDGSVAVSAPARASLAAVDAFVEAKSVWLWAAREKALAQKSREEAEALPSREEALARFQALSAQVFPAFAAALHGQEPTVKVRSMKSRWGVCVPAKRQLTFAVRLAAQPPEAQLYVVVHEYCHFLQPNHSPAFWHEVERLLPDWKARRKLLRG